MITFNCNNCKQSISAEPSDQGMEAECPACGTPIVVPEPKSSPEEDERSVISHDPENSPPATTDNTAPLGFLKKIPIGVQVALVVTGCLALYFSLSKLTSKKDHEKETRQVKVIPPPEVENDRYTLNPTESDFQFLLGMEYLHGDGTFYKNRDNQIILKDYREGYKWIRKSAEQDNPLGQVKLGYLYFEGEGVDRDYDKAARWWNAAANQGNRIGQVQMGKLYSMGLGVGGKNNILAYMWFNLAASGNHDMTESARRGRSDLERKMTNEEIIEAQRLSREWKPKKNR